MPKFFRTFMLVLCAFTAMSVEMHALNASASGLPTQEVVVYAPFSDGQVLQMAAVSAPSFNNVNSMLNRKVSTSGNYSRNSRKSSGSYNYSVYSQRTRSVRSVGASTNSRGGSYNGSTTTRRGATYSATGGAADRLGVANVVRTTTPMREQTETSSGGSIVSEGDGNLRPGELPEIVPDTPIGDAILPLLLMLALYTAIRFFRRKANAGASSATAANVTNVVE